MKMNFPPQHGTLERCKTLSLSRKSLNILCILVWKCEFCHHFIINPKKHPENKSKVWKGLKKLLFCILHLSQLSFSSSHRTQKELFTCFMSKIMSDGEKSEACSNIWSYKSLFCFTCKRVRMRNFSSNEFF